MKVLISVIFALFIAGCATIPPVPQHTFNIKYDHERGKVTMPEEDFFLLYNAYNLYYEIDSPKEGK